MVPWPREQLDDTGTTSFFVTRLGRISNACGRLQGAGHWLVLVYLVVVVVEDMHGYFLFSIDVSRSNIDLDKDGTDNQ